MSYNKAPGQSGLTTDMIKDLPPKALDFLIKRIQDFWQNPDVDYDAWHTYILSTICKGKGDPQDPIFTAFNTVHHNILCQILSK